MGIVVVLIFYALVLGTLAVIGSGIFVLGTRALIRSGQTGRRRAVLAAGAFPFVCLMYVGLLFVVYATVNGFVFHRDPGLGDGWSTPLPNRYALMMIDVTDQGTVYDPRTQVGGQGSIVEQKDAVFGVRRLQVSGNLIFGARDSGYFNSIGKVSDHEDGYFALDTATKARADFGSEEELRGEASQRGVSLNLRPFAKVFGEYRYGWFDFAAIAALILPPIGGFWWLLRIVLKTRRSGWGSGVMAEQVI